MARNYVGGEAEFVHNGFALVDMKLPDGTLVTELSPRRLFTVSNGEQYISLLDADGSEKAIIRDIAELSKESASVIRNVLEEYYIMPKIVAVLDIDDKDGGAIWKVMTDHGERTFRVKTRVSDIKSLSNGRVLFRDSSDNRYEIPDWTKLDKHSKHLLFSQI